MARQTKRLFIGVFALACCCVPNAYAAIPDQFENFSDGAFADDDALFAAGYVFSNGGGLDPAQLFGDTDGGDGLNDGAIFVDGEAIQGSVQYAFSGTIEDGVEYRFGAQLFRSAGSFTDAEVELLAGGSVVASIPFEATLTGAGPATEPMGPSSSPSGTFPATLYYKGEASTAGQPLSFRVKQTRGFEVSFDVGIDRWELQAAAPSTPLADQSETFTGFAPIGYEWSIRAGYVESGNDPLTDPYGANPGDAALDGAIFVDGNDAGSPRSVVEHRFDGFLEDGQLYEFSANLFQSSISFGRTTVELIVDPGGPDEAIVASSDPDLTVNGKPNEVGAALFSLVDVDYTADATTAGKGLAFRISSDRDAGGSSSEVGIDGWSLVLAEALVGDYNSDGFVDAADYTVWRDTFGSIGDLRADGDGSGEIDNGDYTTWETNYGAASGSQASSVPEPGALLLIAAALVCLPSTRSKS